MIYHKYDSLSKIHLHASKIQKIIRQIAGYITASRVTTENELGRDGLKDEIAVVYI